MLYWGLYWWLCRGYIGGYLGAVFGLMETYTSKPVHVLQGRLADPAERNFLGTHILFNELLSL